MYMLTICGKRYAHFDKPFDGVRALLSDAYQYGFLA